MRNLIAKILIIILVNIGLLFSQREVFQLQPFLLLITIPIQIFATLYFPYEKFINVFNTVENNNNKENNILTEEILYNYGFTKVNLEDSPFKEYKMNYYCNNSVILFYNEGEYNKNSFYIGYAQQHFGEYKVVCFRWIDKENELREIYEVITKKKLIKNNI